MSLKTVDRRGRPLKLNNQDDYTPKPAAKSPILSKRDLLINGVVDAIMKKVKTGMSR
jgi:hypothetical protein